MATTKPVATFPAKTAQAPAVVGGPISGKGLAALADGIAGTAAKKAPARKAAAKPAAKKAVAAKAPAKAAAKKAPARKDALTVLAEQTGAKSKAAKPRSAAAKRATPVPVKSVATKAAKPATAPVVKPVKGEPTKHQVKNVAALIKFLSTMPSGGGFEVAKARGKSVLQVTNIRGRVIAEVTQVAK